MVCTGSWHMRAHDVEGFTVCKGSWHVGNHGMKGFTECRVPSTYRRGSEHMSLWRIGVPDEYKRELLTKGRVWYVRILELEELFTCRKSWLVDILNKSELWNCMIFKNKILMSFTLIFREACLLDSSDCTPRYTPSSLLIVSYSFTTIEV